RKPRANPALAQFRGPPILPDDRIMNRATGRTLPQNSGLALVGDADRGNRAVRSGNCFTAGRDDAPPDLFGIVFDPARLRILLRQLGLGGGTRPSGPVEQDCTGARCAL